MYKGACVGMLDIAYMNGILVYTAYLKAQMGSLCKCKYYNQNDFFFLEDIVIRLKFVHVYG